MQQGVSFDDYRFEIETGRLWSGTEEIRLTPKAAAVLAELVTHAGEPVSKEDLFASVWKNTAVSDDALTSCIQELRRALERRPAEQPRFIETRHRRGYRFVARYGGPPLVPIADASPTAATRPTQRYLRHRRAAVRGHEPGRDQDYLCEGSRRGADQRADAHRRPARRLANRVLSVSRQRRRHSGDRPASRRRDAARRQRPQGGRSAARDGAADRSRDRLPPLVAALRSHGSTTCSRSRTRSRRASRRRCAAAC